MNRNNQSNAALNPNMDLQDHIALAHALRSATLDMYFRRLMSSINSAINSVARRAARRTALS